MSLRLLVSIITFVGALSAPSAADHTQGVTPSGAASAVIWFKPTTPASLVDVHYLVSGVPQQNVRMTDRGGTWEKTVGDLSSGTRVEYWFTYEKGGPLYDTPRFTYTHNGSGGAGPGTFPVTFTNNTAGRWSDSQIHIMILGMPTPGEWHYLKSDGTLAHIDQSEENAPGHLTKNGRNYADMSFTLAQARTVTIPSRIEGARMYVSLGSPMYIPISPDNRGWGGPDLANPSDPNQDVHFDWYEFTYAHSAIPFGGNTTQVDMFGFPMTARLQQSAIGYDETVGITLTRDQVRSRYTAAVGSPFRPLVNDHRIVAPRSSPLFRQSEYLKPVIDQVWNHYTANQFTLNRLGVTFTGRVSGGRLQFTRNGAGPYFLNKPTTKDVVECSGALASAGMSTVELELGAEFCAAFNRGVAMNPAAWWGTASGYYPAGVARNDYAGFFHTVGLQGRAYGFAYDDINDQSSVKILPNANPPTRLTIGIGW
ncbi:glycoside hydrolase family 64 protein [Nonomuraea sp. bgisy101]|uniref:glycoside hydrolase family 64 protein n=1 Tax=Nonomuraea sp. bgisy101 TaxID=3413784 RepID=UPI003D708DFA